MFANEWMQIAGFVLCVVSVSLVYLASNQQLWIRTPLPLPVGWLGAVIAASAAVYVWQGVMGWMPAAFGVAVCLMLLATLLPYLSLWIKRSPHEL